MPALTRSHDRYRDPVPGLPDRAIVLTNSERKLMACSRKYLLAVIEGLRPKRASMALGYGAYWHLLKESVHRAWLQDRKPTDPELEAAFSAIRLAERETVERGGREVEESADLLAALAKNLDVWLMVTGGGAPPSEYRLIAYEIPLAMPVRSASGQIYRPRTLICRDGADLRLARPGERNDVSTVRWPVYFLGRLDMVLVHRTTGVVWVADDKTSANPKDTARRLHADPQVPSYLALLRYAISRGDLQHLGVQPGTPVAGFWHRVTSSQEYSAPRILKNGSLSQDKRQRIPSWEYMAAIGQNGLEFSEYADFVQHLRENVDEGIERHEFVNYSAADLDRFEREIFGDAIRSHTLWRTAAEAESQEALDVTHLRTPICQLPGGHCDYLGPCTHDGEISRSTFDVRAGQRWSSGETRRPAEPEPVAEPDDRQSLNLGW